jgi:hypothetical protein
MPSRPNKRLALVERRRQVAELALQGWSQGSIAGQLGISQGTVCSDLKAVREEWRQSTIRDFDEARGMELKKLELIEQECWSAWQRSQKPQQSASFQGEGPGPQSHKRVANRYGDPRFLEQVNKCIAQRRALLGLDVASQGFSEDLADGPLSLEVRRERVQAILTGFGYSRATPPDGTRPDDGQLGAIRVGSQPGTLETGTPPPPAG